MVGSGVTVCDTFPLVPTHPFKVGITLYKTVVVVLFELVNVSAMVLVVPLPVAGVMPVTAFLLHANVAPVGTELKVMAVGLPVQIAVGVIAASVGNGLITWLMVAAFPTQPLAVGVTE